jgi:peroxiredoxin
MGIDIYAVLADLKSAVAMKEKTGVDYDILYDENLAMARNMELIHKGAIPVKDIDLAQRLGFYCDFRFNIHYPMRNFQNY